MKPIEFVPITFRLSLEAHQALERMAAVRGLKKNTIVNKIILGHEGALAKKVSAGGGDMTAYKRCVMLHHEFAEALNQYWLGKLANLTKPAAVPPPEAVDGVPAEVAAETNGVAEAATNAA
jgi:hypothetical protein